MIEGPRRTQDLSGAYAVPPAADDAAPGATSADAGGSAEVDTRTRTQRISSAHFAAGALEAALRARLAAFEGGAGGGPTALVRGGPGPSAEALIASELEGGAAGLGAAPPASVAPAAGASSPIGAAYSERALVEPDTPIFGADGSFDAADVVSLLTQYDTTTSTTNDASRCGPTALLAGAMLANGKQGLIDYCDAIAAQAATKGGLGLQSTHDLNGIRKRIEAGTATYDDLGKLGSMAYRMFVSDPAKGFTGMDVSVLARAAKVPSPPMQLALIDPTPDDDDKRAYHWILVGKEKGKELVFDPLPTPDSGTQLHYKAKDEAYFQTENVRPFQAYNASKVVAMYYGW